MVRNTEKQQFFDWNTFFDRFFYIPANWNVQPKKQQKMAEHNFISVFFAKTTFSGFYGLLG